jgi:EPS-associated MarR family transcriptional regulator
MCACRPQLSSRVRRDRPTMLTDELRYKLMRLLEAHPEMSQRDVARALGISLGKVNYCVRALMRKGWIKATNFKNNHNKAAYMYLLTPRGIEAKTKLTVEFLQVKMREYETLRAEIDQMSREAAAANAREADSR